MKKVKETDLQMYLNNATYIDFFNRLKLLATNIFEWKNLDEHFGFGASQFLEDSLFEFGKAVAVNDDKIGLQIFRCNPSNKLNNYYLPTQINAYSINYNKMFNLDDVVYIGNNTSYVPTKNSLELFAYRLYEIENTTDVNLQAQKTPILLEGSEKSMLTLRNVYQKISGGVPIIFANKDFELSKKINAIKTDAPFLLDGLDEHKKQVWGECLTYLGINNVSFEKGERLIKDEVNSNDEMINYYLNLFWKTRKKACDEINEKFLKDSDKKIEVTLNTNVAELLKVNQNAIINLGEEIEPTLDYLEKQESVDNNE